MCAKAPKDYHQHVEHWLCGMGGWISLGRPMIILITTISVLDLGCGDGMVGSALRDRGFSSVHGMDLSPGMLAK